MNCTDWLSSLCCYWNGNLLMLFVDCHTREEGTWTLGMHCIYHAVRNVFNFLTIFKVVFGIRSYRCLWMFSFSHCFTYKLIDIRLIIYPKINICLVLWDKHTRTHMLSLLNWSTCVRWHPQKCRRWHIAKIRRLYLNINSICNVYCDLWCTL